MVGEAAACCNRLSSGLEETAEWQSTRGKKTLNGKRGSRKRKPLVRSSNGIIASRRTSSRPSRALKSSTSDGASKSHATDSMPAQNGQISSLIHRFRFAPPSSPEERRKANANAKLATAPSVSESNVQAVTAPVVEKEKPIAAPVRGSGLEAANALRAGKHRLISSDENNADTLSEVAASPSPTPGEKLARPGMDKPSSPELQALDKQASELLARCDVLLHSSRGSNAAESHDQGHFPAKNIDDERVTESLHESKNEGEKENILSSTAMDTSIDSIGAKLVAASVGDGLFFVGPRIAEQMLGKSH